MTTTTNSVAPKSLKIIAILAILWNLMGVMSYIGQSLITSGQMEGDDLMIMDYPTWVTAAYATAVFSGFIGSITLLMRKKISNLLFILSLVCVIAKSIYDYTIVDNEYFYTTGALVFSALIYLIAIYLIMYSKKGMDKGWLN